MSSETVASSSRSSNPTCLHELSRHQVSSTPNLDLLFKFVSCYRFIGGQKEGSLTGDQKRLESCTATERDHAKPQAGHVRFRTDGWREGGCSALLVSSLTCRRAVGRENKSFRSFKNRYFDRVTAVMLQVAHLSLLLPCPPLPANMP